MKIKEIHVKNFRSILDETLTFDDLTILVGRNGSGKSAFLKALELFYNPSSIKTEVTEEDYYAKVTENEIEIAVIYGELSEKAKLEYGSYVDVSDDHKLKVILVISWENGKPEYSLHGLKLQNPDFNDIRNANKINEKREAYNKLREDKYYSDLAPTFRSFDEINEILDTWEKKNIEDEESENKCILSRDNGQFFGAENVGTGKLGHFTNLILVPAVRDAQEDTEEGKGSSIKKLIDLNVRNAQKIINDIDNFENRVQTEYTKMFGKSTNDRLIDLQRTLNKTLKRYVSDSKIGLKWSEESSVSIKMPEVRIKITEDGHASTVDRVGHGLQRALIFTLLQNVFEAQNVKFASNEQDHSSSDEQNSKQDDGSSLVLAIEEPELYQHPSRQRHFANILSELARGSIKDVVSNIQVVYTTHSPLFVGLDRFHQLRILRKKLSNRKEKITEIKKSSFTNVAKDLARIENKNNVEKIETKLSVKLKVIMTPWLNEGFFADVVVLVEGEHDRAVILGAAKSKKINLDEKGIAVIPCGGKLNLSRPAVIFKQFGIPVYLIWDADKRDSKDKLNANLLRLIEKNINEDEALSFVDHNGACFEDKIETTLVNEIGEELYTRLLAEECNNFDINIDDGLKNVVIAKNIIAKAREDNAEAKSINNIVSAILNLRKDLDSS